ncbi:MAG: ABC transporter ATP-binding protein, partial [Promethearchaeota archaeon]
KVVNMASLVGILLQDPESQLATSRVKDEIILTLEFRGKSRKEIDTQLAYLLDRFDLTEYAEADSTRMSGGEKQLVALAAMLSLDPKIIILDEPTSNLDPYNTSKVLDHVASFKREGKTIILIEHKINEVFNHCPPDQVILMHNGTIVDQGSPRSIFHRKSLERIGLHPPRIYDYCSKITLTPEQQNNLPCSFPEFKEFIPTLSIEQTSQLIQLLKETSRINLITDQKLIDFNDLSFKYRNQAYSALENITSSINKGEFIAIVGNNGAGKSTLVKHIIGLIKPETGNVVIDGINSRKLTAAKLARKVAFLFQNPDYQLFNASVIKEVAYGARNCGMDKEEANEKARKSIKEVKLGKYTEGDPLKLSMGQKQRVAVASALTMNPEVYVLDEPTTGQDPTSLKGIMELMLNEYQESNATIILVTHDMDLVDSVANRVLAMNKGKIIGDNVTDNIFLNQNLLDQCNLQPPIRLKMLSLIQH